MSKLAALVPVRHHSQRVPGKNYRSLGGKPLFHHIISTLLTCPEVDEVVVNTDSMPVIEGLQIHFPQVRIIKRPAHLCADEIPMNEILAYDTEVVDADFYLQTHTTNPLLHSTTISAAVNKFLAVYPAYDSLFSVTRLQTRLWDQLGRAINHNPNLLLQTQDLPPVYEENSCMYIFRRETLMARRNRLGERPLMYEISASEAWDIDDELDFGLADFLMSQDKAVK